MTASLGYLAAAALLIFLAALFSARKIERKLPTKWLGWAAAVTILILILVWIIFTVLLPKDAGMRQPERLPAYPTPSG